jgi:hypothetical protein
LTETLRNINGDTIEIRIHHDDFCILEDMLAKLLGIDIEQLHAIIFQLIEENKIAINTNIIYHAWSGSSGGKLYKLRTNEIAKYKENLKESCLDDDRLKIVISSEAIKEIFKIFDFKEAERFLEYAERALEDSRMFSCFVQGIICGIDDSIYKINFGDQLQIASLSMPDNNDFLQRYWSILDVFSFNHKFNNAILKGQGKVNTLISKGEKGYLTEIMDEQGKISLDGINIVSISSKVKDIINILRLLDLFQKKQFGVVN